MPVSCVMLQRKELINMSSNWKNHQLQFWNGPKLDMTLVITLSSCSFLLEKTFKPTPFPRTLSSWQQSKFGVKTIFHLKEGTVQYHQLVPVLSILEFHSILMYKMGLQNRRHKRVPCYSASYWNVPMMSK